MTPTEVIWKINKKTSALDEGGPQGPGNPPLAHPSCTQAAPGDLYRTAGAPLELAELGPPCSQPAFPLSSFCSGASHFRLSFLEICKMGTHTKHQVKLQPPLPASTLQSSRHPLPPQPGETSPGQPGGLGSTMTPRHPESKTPSWHIHPDAPCAGAECRLPGRVWRFRQ